MKEKFGILGTADIAYRRFLPALMADDEVEYIGIATRNIKKGIKFSDYYGGKVYEGYEEILRNEEVTSVYIPLPPALHFEWGLKCLDYKINVFMEKPFATNLQEALQLVQKAATVNKIIFENYMFLYHKQLQKIKNLIFKEQILGDIRLFRINFSFPKRGDNDFRYKKSLGGGALLDCGGYTIRLAKELLGDKIHVDTAKLNYVPDYEVDLFGTATLEDENGLIAQIAFGMDNGYKCELEIIGQKGWLRAPRIFTAPKDYVVEISTNIQNQESKIIVGKDDQFLNAIHVYKDMIRNKERRKKVYSDIIHTAKLLDQVKEWR